MAHNEFAEVTREQSRLIFKRALVVSATRAFASFARRLPRLLSLRAEHFPFPSPARSLLRPSLN